MPWSCRLIDFQDYLARGERPRTGDMWYAPELVEAGDDHMQEYWRTKVLSAEYERDWLGKRPPLIVVLPSGTWFNVDEQVTDAVDRHGWTVTGEAPHITVSPSINCVGIYHGWLQAGVLSDDVEGRTYGEQP